MRMARFLRAAGLAVVLVWWARLMLHSKERSPEGRWREITLDELS